MRNDFGEREPARQSAATDAIIAVVVSCVILLAALIGPLLFR